MRKRQMETYSASSRTPLVVGLLALITVLVLGLVWQAAQTLMTNRATAAKVLQDYARLAGDEYVRRAMGEIGYYGYYNYIGLLAKQVNAGNGIQQEPHGADRIEPGRASLAAYRFLLDRSTSELRTSLPVPVEISNGLPLLAVSVLALPPAESGLTIVHDVIEGRAHTFVLAISDSGGSVFGFEVNREELSLRLGKVFEENILMPGSLADGAITNEHVYLRFDDDSGATLFESRGRYDPYLVNSETVGDDYGGVFEGYTITAALDPAIADSLVIGGLPRSRLPVLVITVLLTIGLLVAAIRQLYRERALMKLRSDFVSEVSHELRTPLTQIRMFTETLLLDRFTRDDDRRRALGIVNRESQRLSHLVENVLRFSGRSGDRREINSKRGKVAPVIEHVVEEFRPLADAADNRLALDLDVEAEAAFDADAIKQVLLNLLDNAVKYGPVGQSVRIRLADLPQGVQVSVHDQGPGIPESESDNIWNPYHRLERDRASAIAGTGIGLSLVRDLIAQHGGTVTVKNDAGACFTIELPKSVNPQ